MNKHEKINYVEFASTNLSETKHFFSQVFGWSFQDYGPDYTSFSDQGIDGGFYRADLPSSSNTTTSLIIFFSNDLEATLEKIEQAGGTIIKPIYTFPGGRRFHFCEPGGNELAVWSDNK